MRVGYLQFKPELHSIKRNCEKVKDMLKDFDADMIVLPELSNSGYLFENKEDAMSTAENPDTGKFCKTLKLIAKEKNCCIISGFNELSNKLNEKVSYNSSILIYPDSKYRIYRKTHLFFDEPLFFEAGNSGFWTYDIPVKNGGMVKIGMMICFDWIFPEAARTLTLRGAQIICHPSNLVMPYCQKAMFARAVENRVFIITANRIGIDKGKNIEYNFTGNSVIVNPEGKYLIEGSIDKEELKIIDIDPSEANNKFINSKNNIIEERRPELYYQYKK